MLRNFSHCAVADDFIQLATLCQTGFPCLKGCPRQSAGKPRDAGRGGYGRRAHGDQRCRIDRRPDRRDAGQRAPRGADADRQLSADRPEDRRRFLAAGGRQLADHPALRRPARLPELSRIPVGPAGRTRRAVAVAAQPQPKIRPRPRPATIRRSSRRSSRTSARRSGTSRTSRWSTLRRSLPTIAPRRFSSAAVSPTRSPATWPRI